MGHRNRHPWPEHRAPFYLGVTSRFGARGIAAPPTRALPDLSERKTHHACVGPDAHCDEDPAPPRDMSWRSGDKIRHIKIDIGHRALCRQDLAAASPRGVRQKHPGTARRVHSCIACGCYSGRRCGSVHRRHEMLAITVRTGGRWHEHRVKKGSRQIL